MTVIDMRFKNIVISYLPRIAKSLEEINEKMFKKCCLCGKEFVGYGNNPSPLSDNGVCCDECNVKVIAARIKEIKEVK